MAWLTKPGTKKRRTGAWIFAKLIGITNPDKRDVLEIVPNIDQQPTDSDITNYMIGKDIHYIVANKIEKQKGS